MVSDSPTAKGSASPKSPAAAGSPAPVRSPPRDTGATAPLIEADEVEEEPVIDDGDSAIGSFQSSTASVKEELIKQRNEYGRKYQGYMEAKYLLPMDERELERLELQNHLVWMSLERKLYHAPVTNFDRVLDIGCGTGQWTIEFADEHPESEVLGVDLAPVQPNSIPPNLKFEVDDLEMPWNFTTKFNYIHTEAMIGAFQDWPKYFNQSFEFLEPGGYLELHDVDFNIHCDDGTVPKDAPIVKWHAYLHEAAQKMGLSLGIVHEFPEMMRAAGYTDITSRTFKWPSNTWPKEKKYKEIGWLACENFSWGCESMSLALMTRGLGWSVDEVRVFMAGLRKDFANRKMHAYWNFYAIYGRKPESEH